MSDPLESAIADEPAKTPLFQKHVALAARMVPFAGYAMPVQYEAGVMREHLATRQSAGLFDVSHMGQAFIDSDADTASVMERLVPGDIQGLAPGQVRYSVLLDDRGCIIDDLMISRLADDPNRLFIVVNAGRKDVDFAHIKAGLKGEARLTLAPERALIALQGPKAASVLERFVPDIAAMKFMTITRTVMNGVDAIITRSGYTGEDGFEISILDQNAGYIWDLLLAESEVSAIGLGARDSLRLEAGLCLYGHDIDLTTTPVEASLSWVIPKRRRQAADFPGAATILKQLADGPARKRVGLRSLGRAPVREGAEIVDADGHVIGTVTSGTFSPSLNTPIAMGYVPSTFSAIGTQLGLMVRGKPQAAEVCAMPFVPHHYVK
jgi:aminomethyltransferase